MNLRGRRDSENHASEGLRDFADRFPAYFLSDNEGFCSCLTPI